MPLLWVPGAVEEVEYPGMVRELSPADVELSEDELHTLPRGRARRLGARPPDGAHTHALLDSPERREALKTGARLERVRPRLAPAP